MARARANRPVSFEALEPRIALTDAHDLFGPEWPFPYSESENVFPPPVSPFHEYPGLHDVLGDGPPVLIEGHTIPHNVDHLLPPLPPTADAA